MAADEHNSKHQEHAPREHAVGAWGCFLDRVVVWMLKMYIPDNGSAEIVDSDDN